MMPDSMDESAVSARHVDAAVQELRVVIIRLAGMGKSAAEIRSFAMQWGEIVADPPLPAAKVEDVLIDQLLKLTPVERVAQAPIVPDDEQPPIESETARAQIEHDDEADFERKDGDTETPLGCVVDFATLAQTPAPTFRWYVPGWLSPHPTLLSGKGGMGKSLTALQMAIALATGKQFIGRPVDPLKVLLWSCEEDLPELHRRLERICEFYEIGVADLSENLTIDCRHGLDNTLLSHDHGRPLWTARAEYLREQVNDLKPDIWIGDNIAHLYACSENDRHQVTVFTSWLSGLRRESSWCPLLIGHVAKVGGSEYSGSTAWENAVRMRWYLGDKLPEEDKTAADEEDGEPGNIRFLCKRKTNYDQKDYVRFTMQDGLLIPENVEPAASGDSGLMATLRARKARDVVLTALRQIAAMGVNASDRGGQSNLTRLILHYKLAQGCSPRQLSSALAELMVEGVIVRGETGRDSSRRKREGLLIVDRPASH